MTRDELQRVFLEALVHVAPEVDPESIEPDVPLRDQLDLDSMDRLNLMIRLNEVLGVEVPERDYPRLESVAAAAGYLANALEEAR